MSAAPATKPTPAALEAIFEQIAAEIGETPSQRLVRESREARLKATTDRIPSALTNENAARIAAALDRLSNTLARPQYRIATLKTADGPITLRLTEGRLPQVENTGVLSLVGSAAKLKALLDAPVRKSGTATVETSDGPLNVSHIQHKPTEVNHA